MRTNTVIVDKLGVIDVSSDGEKMLNIYMVDMLFLLLVPVYLCVCGRGGGGGQFRCDKKIQMSYPYRTYTRPPTFLVKYFNKTVDG